jgi:predicted nucleic acid-binding protein
MSQGLKGKLALDTSALIELVYAEAAGLKLKKALASDIVEAWTTELAIAELKYVLCRELGWVQSNERVSKLLSSGYINLENTAPLIDAASKIKCQRAISLPDCFTLALAHKISGNALFARKEEDLTKEMQRKKFDATILFLEDQ